MISQSRNVALAYFISQVVTWGTNYTPPTNSPPNLTVLAPQIIEVSCVSTKPTDPEPLPTWNFPTTNGIIELPSLSSFQITVNDQPITVNRVGLKRRAIYAPLRTRDLRIASWLYLELATPITPDQEVTLVINDPQIAPNILTLTTQNNPDRQSSIIHINQTGYATTLPKTAFVGGFLGTLGELQIASDTFELIDATTGLPRFSGKLVANPDIGFTAPAPYQAVKIADFSAFVQPGQYRLRVPGIGCSAAFRINDDILAAFSRTYALGIYHQRCGTDNSLPWTRFTHDPCHTAPATIPTIENTFLATTLADMSTTADPRYTAPPLNSITASLYPFQKTGTVDVSGGHHDAGDYSKYTINSAQFIHHMVFAADNFPGVGTLDNLGLPESGDGRSDILQEAKWEADFLVKLQDTDGGFYYLVYPQNRKYESNVLPDQGDPQTVFPKTTTATAAATAALAQIASSPTFKAQFPEAAAHYLQAAKLGWEFLQTAIAQNSRNGAYQTLPYGNVFGHEDELAWAAAEMFAATGDATYETQLKSNFDPNLKENRRWTWWRLFEGYGAATRSYAFAARSGRLPITNLDPTYLAKCEAEIIAAANDLQTWSENTAYGTSFPDASKRQRNAGWYFSTARAFDLIAAYQLDPRQSWLMAILNNLNYEAGANPLNLSFITGLGEQRPLITVSQYNLNDNRNLPPIGFPIGQLVTGFPWLYYYEKEASNLAVPSDGAATETYPLYDRWTDTWNTGTEPVIVDQARSLITTAYLFARTTARNQTWTSAPAHITTQPLAEPGTWLCTLTTSNYNLDQAQITWETANTTTTGSNTFLYHVDQTGEQWIEAEAQTPDGRRVFAQTHFLAARAPNPALPTLTISTPNQNAAFSPYVIGTFDIEATKTPTATLPVLYNITGTARNGTHYAWINGNQYTVNRGTNCLVPNNLHLPLYVKPNPVNPITTDKTVVISLAPSTNYNIGLPHQATITIHAPKPVNRPPTAQNIQSPFRAEASIPLVLSGTDPDDDTLQFCVLTLPTVGTLSGTPPNLVYTPGPEFNGIDQFTYATQDAQYQSSPATVTIIRDLTTTISVYSFNQNLEDAMQRLPNLQTVGLAQLHEGALRLNTLNDAVYTTIPFGTIKVDAATTELALECRLFIEQFLAYSKDTVPLLKLYRNWNSYLEVRQDKWARNAQARINTQTIATTEDLQPYLTTNQWHHLSLRIHPNDCHLIVDGHPIANNTNTTLTTWRTAGPTTLEAGHFAGWLDWLEIRATPNPFNNSLPSP